MSSPVQVAAIALEVGASPRRHMVFIAGVPVGPLSLGTAGDWPVVAGGVLPVHAYLFFDGTKLLVASASGDVARAVALNGSPVGGGWTVVPLPGEVSLGDARFRARVGAERDSAPSTERGGRPKAKTDDGTLFGAPSRPATASYWEDIYAIPLRPEAAPRSAGPVSSRPPEKTVIMRLPEELRSAQRSAHATMPIGSMLSPSLPPVSIGGSVRPPTESSGARKRVAVAGAIVAAALVASGALFFKVRSWRAVPPRVAAIPADAGALTRITASDAGGLAHAASWQVVPARAVAPTERRRTPLADVPSDTERRAVDALAAGSMRDASAVYGQLSAASPDDQALQEAARILRAASE